MNCSLASLIFKTNLLSEGSMNVQAWMDVASWMANEIIKVCSRIFKLALTHLKKLWIGFQIDVLPNWEQMLLQESKYLIKSLNVNEKLFLNSFESFFVVFLKLSPVSLEKLYKSFPKFFRKAFLKFFTKALFNPSVKISSNSCEKFPQIFPNSRSNDALKMNFLGWLGLERKPNFRSAFFFKIFNDFNINIRENPTRKAAYPLELINWTTSTAASQVPRWKNSSAKRVEKFISAPINPEFTFDVSRQQCLSKILAEALRTSSFEFKSRFVYRLQSLPHR